MGDHRHAVRGVLAGIAGGLVAFWVMNEFIVGPGVKLQHAIQTDEVNRSQELVRRIIRRIL